jgi:hypothetical protein
MFSKENNKKFITNFVINVIVLSLFTWVANHHNITCKVTILVIFIPSLFLSFLYSYINFNEYMNDVMKKQEDRFK